ncbi:MAG: hypothetical protein JXB38_10685 [Anaerolineales bacterium]|nr:hypothetical protein [Anaerolineales bacterium]
MVDPLEQFWNEILSRQPDKVRAAFAGLDTEAKQAVLTHLESMVSESGWHPEQVRSAQAALAALRPEDGFVEGIDAHE